MSNDMSEARLASRRTYAVRRVARTAATLRDLPADLWPDATRDEIRRHAEQIERLAASVAPRTVSAS